MIIEGNSVFYPIEIEQSAKVTADETSVLTVLDKLENKKRDIGAVICMYSQHGVLLENALQIPVRYI